MSGKLSEFLDGFQGAYQEWSALIPDNVAGTGVATAAPSASSLDSLYGDLTSVITELLDLLDG